MTSDASDGEKRARGIAAALAIGSDDKSPADREPAAPASLDESESEDESYVTDATKRVMSALRSDDTKAFKAALRDFVDLVKG